MPLCVLASSSIERHGAQCDFASMAGFECPGYNGNVPTMFSLAQANKAFDASGGIADPHLAIRFDATIMAFLDLVEAAKHYGHMKQSWYEFLGEQVTEETAPVDG